MYLWVKEEQSSEKQQDGHHGQGWSNATGTLPTGTAPNKQTVDPAPSCHATVNEPQNATHAQPQAQHASTGLSQDNLQGQHKRQRVTPLAGEDQPKAPSAGPMGDVSSPAGRLQPIIVATQAVRLTFSQFFVSWSGVLTLAFTGLPPELSQLKAQIEHKLPYLQTLKPENPGSKWPKVSLGALKDGKRLSLEQLLKLRRICSDLSKELAMEGQVLVDNLSVVLFAKCSLEETLSVANIPLLLPSSDSTPSDLELSNVDKVMQEFAPDRLEQYWFNVSKDGNRISHYRNCKLGATLVHFLRDTPGAVRRFRTAVDGELPDMYDWFREDALHVTIRALI